MTAPTSKTRTYHILINIRLANTTFASNELLRPGVHFALTLDLFDVHCHLD
jgi:hypothetical protein